MTHSNLFHRTIAMGFGKVKENFCSCPSFFLVFFKAVPLAFIFEPLSCYSIVTFNAVLWSWSHLSHNSHNGSIKVAKIEDVINTSADFLLNAISIYFLSFLNVITFRIFDSLLVVKKVQSYLIFIRFFLFFGLVLI